MKCKKTWVIVGVVTLAIGVAVGVAAKSHRKQHMQSVGKYLANVCVSRVEGYGKPNVPQDLPPYMRHRIADIESKVSRWCVEAKQAHRSQAQLAK